MDWKCSDKEGEKMNIWIIVPILLSALVGTVLLLSSFVKHVKSSENMVETADKSLKAAVLITLALSVTAALVAAWSGDKNGSVFI